MEFKQSITIRFRFNNQVIEKKIEKSEIRIERDIDTWLFYFEGPERPAPFYIRFEVWGSLDAHGEPITSEQFAVNVIEIDEEGDGEVIEQIDDIDVIECI